MLQKMDDIKRNRFAEWFILASMCKHAKGQGFNSPSKVEGWKDMDFSTCSIEFKINGVDVEFVDMMDRIKEEFDHKVEEQAHEFVKDKLFEMDEYFEEIKQLGLTNIREKFIKENKEEC